MNKQRKNQLAKIVGKLEAIREELETLIEQENEAYDNLPDSLQESERGIYMGECIDSMDSAHSNIDDAISSIEEITEE